jgi:hypothetical protein
MNWLSEGVVEELVLSWGLLRQASAILDGYADICHGLVRIICH